MDMETTFSALPGRQEAFHRVAGVADLPPLAGALERLLEVIYSEVASVRELESIILYDQALAAKLLRLANSSFYGSRGQVYTVAQAIMLIGFEQVKSICLCVLLMQLYSDAPALSVGQRERLWKHAFAAAHMAREVARVKPWVSKELAYVLGLFHDLGRLTMAVHFKRLLSPGHRSGQDAQDSPPAGGVRMRPHAYGNRRLDERQMGAPRSLYPRDGISPQTASEP